MFAYISKRGQGGITNFGCATHGNISLAQSLARVVTNKGGDVWTNCPVKRILITNGSVAGIVVEKNNKDIDLISTVGGRNV